MKIEANVEKVKTIWQIKNDLLGSNTYMCAIGEQNECVLIDPGSNTDDANEIISSNNLTPKNIFFTHGHFGHIAGAYFFQQKYGCLVHIPENDIDIAKKSNFMMMAFGYKERITLPRFDVEVSDKYKETVGELEIFYFSCPGHTLGSSAIKMGGALFTGDTLYARDVALSKLPGADENKLRESITGIFNQFDENILILPGHGRAATLSDIKDNNSKLQTFLENETVIEKEPKND